jgi:hypothetical protein
VELQVLVADAGHLHLPVGRQGAHLLQVRRSASSRSMRAVQTCSRVEGRAGSCLALSRS